MEFEAFLFLVSAGAGALLCLCYELAAAVRSVLPRHRLLGAALDLIYWLMAGIFLFWEAYRWNQGCLRSFFFLGNLLGAWICRCTVSPLFRKFLEGTLRISVKIVKKTTNRLLFFLKSCSILVYKHQAAQKKKHLEKKRISQVEKIKKKKNQKKNSE